VRRLYRRNVADNITKNNPMQSPEVVNNSLAEDQTEAKQPSLKWYPYFLVNGNIKEKVRKQPFEFSDCPTREDVEMAIIESKFHPSGRYKVEKRKNGQPVEFFYCEKPEFSFFQQNISKPIIEVEPDFDDIDDSDEPEFDLNAEIETRAELISLRREMREIKKLERERSETAQNSQSEVLSMMREMQKQSDKAFQNGREQGLEMMKMFMQLQPQPSQQNPTELMLSMLKGTLEVQRGVRELSDEISPDAGGASSFIADAARLVDSVGNNAGKLLPLVLGRGLPQANGKPVKSRPATNQTANGNGQGELSNLLDKVKKKNKQEGKK
jgi:hypothetical protein